MSAVADRLTHGLSFLPEIVCPSYCPSRSVCLFFVLHTPRDFRLKSVSRLSVCLSFCLKLCVRLSVRDYVCLVLFFALHLGISVPVDDDLCLADFSTCFDILMK